MIHWYGDYAGGTGYSTAATGNVLALDKAGYKVRAIPLYYGEIDERSPVHKFSLVDSSKSPKEKKMRVMHSLPYTIKSGIDGQYTVFEFDRIPYQWLEVLKHDVKVIFTPSQFSKNSMVNTGVPAQKIFVAWHPIFGNPPEKYERGIFEGVKESFKFLSVFEWVIRKRTDILIKAFVEEFDEKEDVALILKTHGKDIGRQINKYGANKHVYLMNDMVDRIDKLYRAADVYVSAPAGEGFGLTLAEAMALGVPTISSKYGGQLEFMNEKNSWLCEVGRLEPVGHWKENTLPYIVTPSMKWRVPDIDSLRSLLRETYNEFKGKSIEERLNHPKVREAMKVVDQLSLENVGKQLSIGIEWWNDKYGT